MVISEGIGSFDLDNITLEKTVDLGSNGVADIRIRTYSETVVY